MKEKVTLVKLTAAERASFILENQRAFKYGAAEEFGLRDEHFDADGEIISRKTVETCIDHGTAYCILADGRTVGGLVVSIHPETGRNELELLFVYPEEHGKGIGQAAWFALEALYPETKVWETVTPYFEKRNIHFYMNKCGFRAVEFYCEKHRDPAEPEGFEEGPDEMFRFEKVMK